MPSVLLVVGASVLFFSPFLQRVTDTREFRSKPLSDEWLVDVFGGVLVAAMNRND